MTTYTEEIIKLRDRVALGNEKLYFAWEKIKNMEREERKQTLQQFDEANKKLMGLCSQLKLMGYTECLYIREGRKNKGCLYNADQPGWFCYVCPSQTPYWEEELMSLPSPSKGN